MKSLLTASVFAVLCFPRILASPIEWVVETKDDLEAIGAKVRVSFTPAKEPGGPGIASFEAVWIDEKQPPDIQRCMLNLVISAPNPLNQFVSVGSRFTIKLGERGQRGVPIRAEFRASEVELESTVLAFWRGGAAEFAWETVHYLSLRRAVDGLSAEIDPFAQPINNKPNDPEIVTPKKLSD